MRPKDVASALRKRLWFVIACVVVAALAAAAASFLQKPVYKAEISMAATAAKDPTTNLPNPMFSLGIAAAMPSIANASVSTEIATAVSDRLARSGTVISADELMKKVTSTAVQSTSAMKITAKDSSRTRVAEIANTWGEEASKRLSKTPLLLGGDLQFTNPATAPGSPTQPKPLVYLGLGLFLGLVVGLAGAVGWEYFEPHFRSPSDARDELGVPVLGLIPRLGKHLSAATPITEVEADSPLYDSYNELRSCLISAEHDAAGHAVLVSGAAERNPLLVLNLAMSVAHAGRHVVLVDADLRDRGLTRILGLEGRPGVAEALANRASVVSLASPTDTEGLFIVAAGTTLENPSDLFCREGFESMIADLRRVFDMVLITAPPFTVAPDAAVIAARADEILLDIDMETCTRSVAQASVGALARMGAVPTGLILSNVRLGRKEKKMRDAAWLAVPAGPAIVSRASGTSRLEAEAAKPLPAAEEPRPAKTVQPEPAPTREVQDTPRQMGERGDPISREWIDGLSSPVAGERDRSSGAIREYYLGMLGKSGVKKEKALEVADAVISFMKREGAFAGMSKEQMEVHIKEMLEGKPARPAAEANTAAYKPGWLHREVAAVKEAQTPANPVWASPVEAKPVEALAGEATEADAAEAEEAQPDRKAARRAEKEQKKADKAAKLAAEEQERQHWLEGKPEAPADKPGGDGETKESRGPKRLLRK